ncbi:MAG: response regulator [Deltaproteobacteria bacterium]|nr:response regulator [Deltaproteobacteria bacterium]
MRLLLVEDDPLIGDAVKTALTQDGYAVDWVTDGEDAIAALALNEHELLILDLGLPLQSGIDVLKSMRRRGNEIPVIILTARDTVQDRIKGLDSGADDYMIKPFDLNELSARIRALGRRKGGQASPLIIHGPVTLDPASHRVTCYGKNIDISHREFSLLSVLMNNKDKVVSKEQLEESLYSWNEEIESNTIEVYIHHLRKKLGPDFIRTVRGVGYILTKE